MDANGVIEVNRCDLKTYFFHVGSSLTPRVTENSDHYGSQGLMAS